MFINCINIKHKNSQTKTQIENAIKYFEIVLLIFKAMAVVMNKVLMKIQKLH